MAPPYRCFLFYAIIKTGRPPRTPLISRVSPYNLAVTGTGEASDRLTAQSEKKGRTMERLKLILSSMGLAKRSSANTHQGQEFGTTQSTLTQPQPGTHTHRKDH